MNPTSREILTRLLQRIEADIRRNALRVTDVAELLRLSTEQVAVREGIEFLRGER